MNKKLELELLRKHKRHILTTVFIGFIGQITYVISALIYMNDAIINKGSNQYLVASILFVVSAAIMIIQTAYTYLS